MTLAEAKKAARYLTSEGWQNPQYVMHRASGHGHYANYSVHLTDPVSGIPKAFGNMEAVKESLQATRFAREYGA